MRVTVVDTETTGADPDDRVVEVAAVTLELTSPRKRGRARSEPTWMITGHWSTLINPEGVAVKHEARAAHHITDEELAGAPTMARVLSANELRRLGVESETWAAHNSQFDLDMLRQSGVPVAARRICTWKCSQHLYPEFKKHGNQFLRYALGVDVPPIAGNLPPHRALADAVVTACVLSAMLREHGVEELLELTTRPVLLQVCKLPKHKNVPWSEVPTNYLRWILRCSDPPFDDDTRYTAQHWLDQKTQPQQRRLV